jgi:hypothetical protein
MEPELEKSFAASRRILGTMTFELELEALCQTFAVVGLQASQSLSIACKRHIRHGHITT